MEWQIIIAIVVAIPVILLPVVLVWYINIAGIYTAVKEAKERKVIEKKGVKEEVII